MSKYLELVEGSFTQEHLDKQKNQNPYVAYSIQDGKVIYTIIPKETSINYFYIESLEDNNVITLDSTTWVGYGDNKSKLEYSNDTTSWTSMSGVDSITINNGERLYMRCIEGNICKDINSIPEEEAEIVMYTPLFKTSTNYNIGGNINTVMFDYTYKTEECVLTTGAFAGLFMGFDIMTEESTSYIIDASKLELPAATLVDMCYYYMFAYCTSLTTAPELSATTLAYTCYSGMFEGCESLTTAPELPATTLAEDCYSYMFAYCTSLVTAPELPATELADYCYSGMFEECQSLTIAPELPATELAEGCYSYMFDYCTSLVTAPGLPATKLAEGCYNSMFQGCKSLTTAPKILPAATLVDMCYYYMFAYCTSLTTAPELPATILTGECYYGMFEGCTNLNYIKCLATDISASYCTNNWVSGVSSTGTFVKDIETNWINGSNGIPSGWIVENVGTIKNAVILTAEESGSTIGLNRLSSYQILEYRTDSSNNWTNMDTSTIITLENVGDKVYMRGVLSGDNDSSNYTQFTMTGKIAASGNCNALWSKDDLNVSLKAYCGYSMFRDCLSLTQAPDLPATTLESNCYQYMFQGCTSLTQAPELPATILAEECYYGMFQGCTALTQAPELPATTLTRECYSAMFYGCTALTQAPELPATTLADACYNGMFLDCTALTQAPDLLATTLTRACYVGMFQGCSNLNYIKCLATEMYIPTEGGMVVVGCTYNWLSGVSSTGTFIKHPDMTDWTTGVDGIPEGWEVKDAVF